jgi:imidazolonepropionase-like amidohydrolase
VAAELLRAEGQLEILAAGAHADVIVLDGDPLEDIGPLADPAAHMGLVIQAGAVVGQR